MEHILLGRALGRDIPVLGICRGIQFINVFLGGSLYQDLPTQRPSCTEHHQKPPYDVPVHEVELMDNSGLFRLLNRKSLSVNSYHHQAIKEKARPLKIMAVADDSIIEAVEMTDKKFVWGIQWHPEFSYKSDENSRLIFEEFVRKCIE
jgi:putative glutamine amidotransferase